MRPFTLQVTRDKPALRPALTRSSLDMPSHEWATCRPPQSRHRGVHSFQFGWESVKAAKPHLKVVQCGKMRRPMRPPMRRDLEGSRRVDATSIQLNHKCHGVLLRWSLAKPSMALPRSTPWRAWHQPDWLARYGWLQRMIMIALRLPERSWARARWSVSARGSRALTSDVRPGGEQA
mgnify:CR=1 FL=1